MAEKFIYSMQNLSRKHGEKQVLKDITLAFFPGAKIGVLGKNGSGKSSLLRIMAGWDTEYEGVAELAKGFTVGYLSQEPKLDPNLDVMGNVMLAVKPLKDLMDRYEAVNAAFGEDGADFDKLMKEQAKLQETIEAQDGWNLERRIEIAMDAMQLPPADAKIDKLSGGEKRRIALCKILLERPDLLLLDEPTNHLDAESVLWLERHLAEYAGTIVAVTHDRYFLDNVAEWILELDRGKGHPFKGNYGSWLEQKKARLMIEEKKESSRQKALERELEWVRTSPSGRTVKNKARLAAYEKMLADSDAGKEEDLEMVIPHGQRLGQLVIEAEGLAKSFGDNLLFEDVNFRLPPGGIVGVIGPNGAGKTTLFKMLLGQEKADAGELRIGDSVVMGYVDQSRDALVDTRTVWEEISDGLEAFDFNGRKMMTRAYASQFNFKGTDQQKKVGTLSGGERNRVHLAKLLRRGVNVLFLDEPTNDLDIDTLRALEEALLNFHGCAVVVSHDRWFLDRIATHILAFEGDSKVYFFEGNFAMYEANKKERLGIDADQPHRIKYKKLTH